MKRLLYLFQWILFCRLVMASQTLDLSQLRDWQIVTAPDASPSELYAAQEFKSYFQQAVGIELPLSSNPSPSTRQIYIGPCISPISDLTGITLDQLGEEGLYIRVTPDRILIVGGRPRGTLYGVYEFLERYLGVRFLTFDHTYIPTQKNRLIPCEEYPYRPPFSFRWSYYKENSDHPEFAARLRVNTTPTEEKYGGVTRQHLISHSLYHLLPVEKYGKEHPEYFALVDGERKLVMGGGGPELCVTNPKVIEIVAENVIRDLDAYPNAQNYSVSQNDNDAYCRCENCEAINQREGTPMGSHLAFVNAVAERVEKKYPQVKIGTLAYWYTRKPPKTLAPRKNIQIQLCSIECCTLHALNDPECEKNREFCRDLEAWSKICKDIWIWNYNTNFRCYDLPFPNWLSIGPNVRYFLENNVKGVFMQANGNGSSGELSDLRNYVISRCLWNPSSDGWKEAEEFCRLHYQEAGEAVIDYLKTMYVHALTNGRHPACFPRPFELGLTSEFSQKIFRKFEIAHSLAKSEETARRVEKASLCSYRAVIETCGKLSFKNDKVTLSWPSPLDRAVERYPQLVERYNVSMAAETMPMPEFIKILKQLKEEGVPALQMENDFWRLTFLPQENGRLVEMIHKPTGRNLLYDPSQGGFARLFDERTCRESGLKGYDSGNPAAFSAQLEGRKLSLTKNLQDGSTVVRTIELGVDRPDGIAFHTTITHQGTEPKLYQCRIQSEFNVETFTRDPLVLTGYLCEKQWMPFTDGWKDWSGPQLDRFEKWNGGAFGFFNHEKQFGLYLTYDPSAMEKPRYGWNSGRPNVGLELMTKSMELKKGESFSYGYKLNYWNRPPE